MAASFLTEWLYPFKKEFSNTLEIGCGQGLLLQQLSQNLETNGYGVDASNEAIDYIKNTFPNLKAKVGLAHDVPYKKKFDLIHLGFFLCYVDREFYFRCISEADRLLKNGGFLSNIDFDTPFPFANDYKHKKGLYIYKQNNSNMFIASGSYSIINNFQFSHNNFFFNKEINERVSLKLLYKET